MGSIETEKFVIGYRKAANKDEYLKKNLEITQYIPYAQKVSEAEKIARATMIDDGGKIRVNSPARFYLVQMRLLALYTNLNVKGTDGPHDFDMLDRDGLIDKICGEMIPKHESTMFNTLVSMAVDDIMTNKYDVHAYVDDALKLLGKVAERMGPAGELLEKAMGEEKETEAINE